MIDIATFRTTRIGTKNVQLRMGGDMACLRGVVKAVLEAAEKDPSVLDAEFLKSSTPASMTTEPLSLRLLGTRWSRSPASQRRPPQARRVVHEV